MEEKRTGLVMEGGAMRGLFTCGVIDVLMENNIDFDGAIGVSAGAVFGCNYKSKQIGRGVRYNKKYCRDKRYASIRSLLRTGDLYNAKFCYSELPNTLDIFDTESFSSNPMEFYVVCTDAHTGEAVYHKCTDGGENDLLWLRASASLPLVSRAVEVEDMELFDGGIADSIPIRQFEKLGYNRNIVIVTRPFDYNKKKTSCLKLIRLLMKRYPKMVEAMSRRHIVYNETVDYIRREEKAGRILVIRPVEPLDIGKVEKNPDELERVYRLGRLQAEEKLDDIVAFLNR